MENSKIVEILISKLKGKTYHESIRILDKAKEKLSEVSIVKMRRN